MCVAVLVETVRPSVTQVEQCWDQNPKGGGGVAWRDIVTAKEADNYHIPPGTPVVRWRKGLKKEQMVALSQELPLPHILHFRQPSHDTSDSITAAHPFTVDASASTSLSGFTTGWVLFHNGHWSEWRKKVESLCLASAKPLPSGAWSDTRAMAWAASILGFGFLEMVGEKVLCLGPGDNDIEMFGGPWLNVISPQGEGTFVVSNRTWERWTSPVTDKRNETSKLLAAGQAAVTVPTGQAGGPAHGTTFPAAAGHTGTATGSGAEGRGHQQESVPQTTPHAHRSAGQGRAQGRQGHAGHLDPLASGVSDGLKLQCKTCGKCTSMGSYIIGMWFCLQCWSKDERRFDDADTNVQRTLSEKLWVGTCERCRVGSSGMRTVIGNSWICRTCWETNGKPKTYYARDGAEAARQRTA